MYLNGFVEDYHFRGGDTIIKVVIPGEVVNKLHKYTKGRAPLELRVDDGRTITNDQRKKIYATLKDIADHTGDAPEQLKEILKYIHMVRTGASYFSLSDCSVTTAKEFINTILEFALQMNIPLTDLALNRTDDMAAWLMTAYHYRVCCICGRPGEVHHVDAIGMGRNRKKHNDGEHEVICLCRQHHNEAHNTGFETFGNKYLVFGVKKKYMEGD